MRTRRAAEAHINECEEGVSVDNAPANDAPPPAKKSRGNDTTASKKPRRAKPGELCKLNLDVLFLIAAYIHPIDLLNLARTCKSLRQLLMDSSSKFVWKEARRQIRRLPACPSDLTEPEYANLVFCARCHGCGKYTKTILWKVRHRYCPGCRIRRLRLLSSCNEVIRKNGVLATECITVKKECQVRVDRDQAAEFMDEYRQSSDKIKLIEHKQKQRSAIIRHAKKCEAWQNRRELELKADKKARLLDRDSEIFYRLDQLGYSPEIGYFSRYSIRQSRESDFRTSKLLTDKEWNKICPEWVEIMNEYRRKRLEVQVYEPRRHSLRVAYENFLRSPSSDAPIFDLLPNVVDVAHFPPFKDIIEAPEEIKVDHGSFAFAFAQLPVLVPEWKKKLDAELTDMVQIPFKGSRRCASASERKARSSGTAPDRLQLACALFQADRPGAFTHLGVLSASTLNCGYEKHREDGSERSVSDRYRIQFLGEAPYIVHACGLDPNVATMDEMDHRNARLQCLYCEESSLVMNWRLAMWHASVYHRTPRGLALLSGSPRWRLVNDEHIGTIEAVEQSITRNTFSDNDYVRCLLCKPHVGDAFRSRYQLVYHLTNGHNVKAMGDGNVDVTQGVHYARIGICDPHSVAVEMIEEGDQASFRAPI